MVGPIIVVMIEGGRAAVDLAVERISRPSTMSLVHADDDIEASILRPFYSLLLMPLTFLWEVLAGVDGALEKSVLN